MKHIKTRQDFLTGIIQYKETYQVKQSDVKTSTLVNEALENDITWGGSLLGRLINSTIRKAVIGSKTLRVNPLLKRLRAELNTIEEAYMDSKSNLEFLKSLVYAIIGKIKEASENPDSTLYNEVQADKPLDLFLGKDDQKGTGLINEAIIRLNKVEEFPDKADLIKALEDFREDLKKLNTTDAGEETEEEEQEEQEPISGSKEVFITSTITILEIIIKMVNTIGSSTPSTTPAAEVSTITAEEKKLKIGGIYTFTDKNKNKKKVKLLSFDHQLDKGPDTKYLTRDDIKKAKLSKPELVFVEFLNPDGTEMKNKPTMAVEVSSLSEEEVQNESFIFEALEDPKANAAYQNILKYYKSSNIKSFLPSLEEIVKGYKEKKETNDFSWAGIVWPTEGSVEKKVIQFGKQILLNLKGVGKPLSETEIVAEAVQFNDATKSVSLFCKAILGLKGKEDLISKLPKISEDVKKVIESFNSLSENVKSLEEKPVEKETKEEGESQKTSQSQAQAQPAEKTQEKFLLRYHNFRRIYEAKSVPEIKIEIGKAYKRNFSPEDEKKWILGEQERLEMSSKFENLKINIDTSKRVDPIVRIANIFGDAYRLFATPQIPSGRPNGRVSQKTWREYKYIGTSPQGGMWSEGAAPTGPFAVKAIYNKWEKGVMAIIEDTALRKIFANKNLSINGNPGAGQTLFTFMNDMIQDSALEDFDKARRNLLTKYFNIEDAPGLNTAQGTVENKKVAEEEVGDPGATLFDIVEKINIGKTQVKSIEKSFYLFYCENKENKKFYMLVYFFGEFKNKEGKTTLVFKYQIDGIDLLNYIQSKDTEKKLPEDDFVKKNLKPNRDVNIGFVSDFPLDRSFTFEGMEIKEFFNKPSDLKSFDYTIVKSWVLNFVDENKTKKPVKIKGAIEDKYRPAKDKGEGLDAIANKYKSK